MEPMDTGRDPFLSDAAEPDLRLLPDIARDRSAAGRARLFALLGSLLMSRWSSLTPSVRGQLAELVALLLPRATPQDRARLIAALAGRPDIPPALRHLASTPEATDTAIPSSTIVPAPADPERTLEPVRPAMRSAHGKPVRISIMQHAVAPRPSPANKAGESAEPNAADQAAGPDAPSRPAAAGDVDLVQPAALVSPPLPERGLAAALASANREARLSRGQDDGAPTLSAPRDNPHRLTGAVLVETLKAGDLARFEMMLAQLTNLRAPLLRRLLKDGGNESFAILARAIGLDAEEFQRHWQHWRQESFNLAPYSRPPSQREGQRIAAFFIALTDRQVERLMERWRNDGNRLFAAEQSA
jgi:hypothetical protein